MRSNVFIALVYHLNPGHCHRTQTTNSPEDLGCFGAFFHSIQFYIQAEDNVTTKGPSFLAQWASPPLTYFPQGRLLGGCCLGCRAEVAKLFTDCRKSMAVCFSESLKCARVRTQTLVDDFD